MDQRLQFWNLMLILSHFAVVPALSITLAKRLFPEFFVLFSMTAVSLVYHSCQVGAVCAFTFSILQEADHFYVYSALVWLVLYFTDAPLEARFCGFFVFQAALFSFTIRYLDTWILAGGVIGGVALLALIYMIFVMKKRPSCDWKDLIIVIALLTVGVILHVVGGTPGTLKYAWSHSLWHTFSMLALYFLIELKDSKSWWSKFYDLVKTGRITKTPLYSV